MRICQSCNKKTSDRRKGIFCGRCIYHARKDYSEKILFYEQELETITERIQYLVFDQLDQFSKYDFNSYKDYMAYVDDAREKRKELNRLSTSADKMCSNLLKLRIDKAIFDYLRDT